MSIRHLEQWLVRQSKARVFVLALLLVVLLCAPAVMSLAQSVQSGQVSAEPLSKPRDPARELALKIIKPFSIASVGDVMIRRPASSLDDSGFQDLLRIIRNADVGFGNMEGNLADIEHFEGPLLGMMGSKEVAGDLKLMGFTMMNRANNHIFDSDREGMIATKALLDAAGIVNAGTGKNLEDARKPVYLETPKGRIALVGMHTPNGDPQRQAASYQEGNIGGRPGLNELRYTTYHIVNQEQFDAIKAIRKSVYTPPPGTTNATKLPETEPNDRVELFDVWYKLGKAAGTKTFEMNKEDLAANLRSIRNGKYFADFMIVTIHAHQGPIEAQQWLFEDQTPDFLIDLAHQCVDNGADVFIGHGPHVLRGIEIYKGKPIFYGLGEFFYQWHMDAMLMSGSWEDARPVAGRGRGADAARGANDNVIDAARQVSPSWRQVNYESVIAVSRYDKGQLAEVRLYPTEGRFEGPVSQLGIPRSAPPEIAQRILARLQSLSKPFGTSIAIEGGIGVIRMAAGASATGGQGRQ
jgi:hypothetical protein